MKGLHKCISTIDQRAVMPLEVGFKCSERGIELARFPKKGRNFLKTYRDGCGRHERGASQQVKGRLRAWNTWPLTSPSERSRGPKLNPAGSFSLYFQEQSQDWFSMANKERTPYPLCRNLSRRCAGGFSKRSVKKKSVLPKLTLPK